MKEIVVEGLLLKRLIRVYEQMETEYNKVAIRLDFTCNGCPDNCCDSYFEHHTYVEWSYLWLGFTRLPADKQKTILKRAEQYQEACTSAIESGQRPQVMCPLNEEGLCILYPYRLLVCRTHGVPASMTRPDGRKIDFPGCFRCQELVKEKGLGDNTVPRMERTPLLRQLALIENDLFAGKRYLYPKVKLTIAGMLLQGPPVVPTPLCER